MTRVYNPLVVEELAQISAARIPSPLHRWSGILHVVDRDVRIDLINAVEFQRVYDENYCDLIYVSFKIDPVVYDRLVQSNIEKLELSLSLTPVKSQYVINGNNGVYRFERMKAKLCDYRSSQQTMDSDLTATLNSTGLPVLRDMSVQIYPKELDVIRTSNFSTNFRLQDPINAIKAAITTFSAQAKLKPMVLSFAPGFTNQQYSQINVPDGTPFFRVPRVINDEVGGIYSTGFSHYIQNGTWYFFSPFDIKRYDQASILPKLTIINVPPNSLNGIEKTWRETENQIIIIATADTKQLDLSETMQETMGTGSRFVDPLKIMEGLTKTQGVFETDPSKFLSELDGIGRKDENVVFDTNVRLTSKYRNVYSRIASRNGSVITTFWQHSAPERLYPGMPVRYIYFVDGKPVEKHGILLGQIDRSIPVNKDITQVIYGYTSYLKLFIGR